MNDELIPVFDLSWSEKLQLVQDLWDDLASSAENANPPDEIVEELERRKANYLKNPGIGTSWEKAKQRIRARHGR